MRRFARTDSLARSRHRSFQRPSPRSKIHAAETYDPTARLLFEGPGRRVRAFMSRSFRLIAAAAFAAGLLCAAPARAQLATLEAANIRLVYFDPGETYIVPHAVRTFLNSLEFQERLFKFQPDQKITVLLADFEDSGNAGATV